ncbi:DNA-deoxyinosine glycosylase [Paenibacillus sp. PL2-23]|uniref:DNA-deoxyinosine glycosylase n=1 Tax=Paenibacillus sp. PL2-23 TaxID=2100729 RepID=UPI0030FB3A66
MSRIYSFPPIVDERSRVLIAGTAPSVKSLQHGQFYGHPHNYFWRVIYGLFQHPVPGQEGYPPPDPDYEQRIRFAREHRLALWDVIASCEREGSLDVNIKGEVPNDIPGLLSEYPGIRCIAFNGSKACDTFRRAFGNHASLEGIALLRMPSTSPIPTRNMRSLEDRLAVWRQLVPYAKGE